MKITFIILLFVLPLFVNGQYINTEAGNGDVLYYGDGGLAVSASIGYPGLITFDRLNNCYFTELNNTVRKITPDGFISTIAGNGTAGYSGDGGLAINAELNCVGGGGLACDINGNIYIADQANNRIRMVDSLGVIHTIAGSGGAGFSGDGGPATAALLNSPECVTIDSLGDLFFTDAFNNRIRKIDTSGIITTIAGDGIAASNGDSGLAINAELYAYSGIYCKGSRLFICDGARLRYIDLSTGYIYNFAGLGTYGYSGDGGMADTAQMNLIIAVVVDDSQNVYLSDIYNNRIRKINSANIISTIAGNGIGGFSGDGGISYFAEINSPRGVAIDVCNNLLFSDNSNHRLRKVTFNPPDTSSITLSGITSSPIGGIVNLTATVAGAGSTYTIQWYDNGVLLTTTTVPSVSFTKVNTIDTITARVIPSGPCNVASVSAPHIITTGPTGIEELTANTENVVVYPNPVHGSINITAGNITDVCITDVMGRVVYEERYIDIAKKELTVNAASFPAGVYIVKVNGCFVQRVVKE